MSLKKKTILIILVFSLSILFFLEGCNTSLSDKEQIKQIAENIQKALEKKDVDLFMENVSYNYSDEEDGTYDNHINGLPEELIAQIEFVEALLDPVPGLKVVTEVSISNLAISDPYATGKMKINISLKLCLGFCINYPGTEEVDIKYDVDFIKEEGEWKIISLAE
ncbi:MAG: hypothetical protein Kow00103_08130 [Candidatus Caldatribacteriota bacterium]